MCCQSSFVHICEACQSVEKFLVIAHVFLKKWHFKNLVDLSNSMNAMSDLTISRKHASLMMVRGREYLLKKKKITEQPF